MFGGMLIATLLVFLYNLFLFTVLDSAAMASTEVVAVTFVAATWGSKAATLMPVLISVGVFGTSCAVFFANSRVILAAARQRHFPAIFSTVNVDSGVPLTSLLLRALLSVLYTFLGSVTFIVEALPLIYALNNGLILVSFFVLRVSMRDAPRPYRAPTVLAAIHVFTYLIPLGARLVQPVHFLPFAFLAGGSIAGCVYYVVFVRLSGIIYDSFAHGGEFCIERITGDRSPAQKSKKQHIDRRIKTSSMRSDSRTLAANCGTSNDVRLNPGSTNRGTSLKREVGLLRTTAILIGCSVGYKSQLGNPVVTPASPSLLLLGHFAEIRKFVVNFAEEIVNPSRNIPRALCGGLLSVTLVVFLLNLFFFIVLDATTVATTEVIAVTFVAATWGSEAANLMPVVISVAVFGTVCAGFFTNSRVI
ncbi:large neutral amino acids transporter small subunit 1-like [Ixodes scapularis]